MPLAKLLKVPEAAEMLALSQKTVWQWIGERRIGVVRLGRAVRVPQSEIERLVTEGSTPARPALEVHCVDSDRRQDEGEFCAGWDGDGR